MAELSRDELKAILDSCISTASGYSDSKLAKERAKVRDFYDAKYPKPLHEGDSKYVSQDVFDAVDTMRADVLEAFSAGQRIVKFNPEGADDVEQAHVATETCRHIVHKMNDAESLFHSVVTDGLWGRIGVAKVYFEEVDNSVEEEFEALTMEELDFILSEDNVELLELEEDEDDGLLYGKLNRIKITQKVKTDPVPPEEFMVSPMAKTIPSSDFVIHRTSVSLSTLRSMGFDEDLIKKIGAGDETILSEEDVIDRFDSIDGATGFSEYQDQERRVTLNEMYVRLDMDKSGVSRLHRVFYCDHVVLDIERTDYIPFVAFVPLPIPHALLGENFAERVIPTQNARTSLVRGIINHTNITNNPRHQVLRGTVNNPRELMDNRLGGMVNVNRLDGIAPIPQAPMNPFVYQTIQLLDEDKEEATGISRLSQGLNKDAISKQNSQGMVDGLVSLSKQRQRIIARQFGKFVRDLYLMVYRVAVENLDAGLMVDIAGSYTPVDPSRWAERRDVEISLTLGHHEKAEEAQKYQGVDQYLASDPRLAPLYTMEKRYEVLRRIAEAQGIVDIDTILRKPEEAEPQQPDPKAMAEVEHLKAQVAQLQSQTAMNEMKTQHEIEMDKLKLEIEQLRAQVDSEAKADKQALDERKESHKEEMDKAELAMAKAVPEESQSAIAAVNA